MKVIISAGVAEVVYEGEYKSYKPRYKMSRELAVEGSIKLRKIPEVNILGILGRYYNESSFLAS